MTGEPLAPSDDDLDVRLRWPTSDPPALGVRPPERPLGRNSGPHEPERPGPGMLPALSARVDQLEHQLGALAQQMEAANESLTSVARQLSAQVEALTQTLDALAAAPKAPRRDDSRLRAHLDELTADVQGMRDEIVQVRKRLPVRSDRDQAAQVERIAERTISRLLEAFELATDEPPAVGPPPAEPPPAEPPPPEPPRKPGRRRDPIVARRTG